MTEASPPIGPAGQLPPLGPEHISCTRGLVDWLIAHNVSLALTTYQAGGVYLVGVDGEHRVGFHHVYVSRAMALWVDTQRLVLSTLNQIWRFENILERGQTLGDADRHYIPRVAHTTGDLDIHDIGILADGRILFVNTLFSCLAELSQVHSFRPYWTPPFITRLAAEDRCHLNGLAMKHGAPAYVTATSRRDIVDGWRARRDEGGCVIDVLSNEIITEKLSMPHSPRWHGNQLWILNSGTGHLGTVDLASGMFRPCVFCPGFLRGLAFHDNHAIVGLSLPRDGAFSGLILDDELGKHDAEPWCGVQIIDLSSGDIVQWIRLQGPVTEMFDVRVLPGVRRPTATSYTDSEISRLLTIEIDGRTRH